MRIALETRQDSQEQGAQYIPVARGVRAGAGQRAALDPAIKDA